jgi:hypothetical protein
VPKLSEIQSGRFADCMKMSDEIPGASPTAAVLRRNQTLANLSAVIPAKAGIQ